MLEENEKYPMIDIFGKQIKIKGYFCAQEDVKVVKLPIKQHQC